MYILVTVAVVQLPALQRPTNPLSPTCQADAQSLAHHWPLMTSPSPWPARVRSSCDLKLWLDPMELLGKAGSGTKHDISTQYRVQFANHPG